MERPGHRGAGAALRYRDRKISQPLCRNRPHPCAQLRQGYRRHRVLPVRCVEDAGYPDGLRRPRQQVGRDEHLQQVHRRPQVLGGLPEGAHRRARHAEGGHVLQPSRGHGRGEGEVHRVPERPGDDRLVVRPLLHLGGQPLRPERLPVHRADLGEQARHGREPARLHQRDASRNAERVHPDAPELHGREGSRGVQGRAYHRPVQDLRRQAHRRGHLRPGRRGRLETTIRRRLDRAHEAALHRCLR